MKRAFTRLAINVLPILFIIIGLGASAQSNAKNNIKPDSRLYDCFTKEYVNDLVKNPRLLLYYNFYLDHSYFVRTSTPDKPVVGTDISTVKLALDEKGESSGSFNEDIANFNEKAFNPLKYNFVTDNENFTVFTLGNTGKAIVFYPQKRFAEMYNEYLKSFNLDK
jgi:hypothetical protein